MVRRHSLSIRVAETLKRFILTEPLDTGARLPPERSMAEMLDVSRTVLREALSQLTDQGIITRVRPRILCVADFDRERVAAELGPIGEYNGALQAVMELRAIIEIGAIEVIVRRITDEQLQELDRLVSEEARRVAAGEPSTSIDAQFHMTLLRAARNEIVDQFLPLIKEQMFLRLERYPFLLATYHSPDHYRTVTEHRQIIEALRNRDAATARLLMLAHVSAYLSWEGWEKSPRADNASALSFLKEIPGE